MNYNNDNNRIFLFNNNNILQHVYIIMLKIKNKFLIRIYF